LSLDKGTRGQGEGETRGKRRACLVSLSPCLLVSVPLAFLLLFYFYPLASILILSFAPEGHLSLAPLEKLFRTPYYLHTLWFTAWQAALSTLLTVGRR